MQLHVSRKQSCCYRVLTKSTCEYCQLSVLTLRVRCSTTYKTHVVTDRLDMLKESPTTVIAMMLSETHEIHTRC